jgi:RNA polymerase sigma factor (sigma-70 family)
MCHDDPPFEAFYRAHLPGLTRYLSRATDAETAKDIAQDSFAAILDRYWGHKPEEDCRKMLYRAALNKARDRWKKAGREVPLDDPGRVCPPDRDPLVANEECRRVLEAIWKLPAKDQLVLLLPEVPALTDARIAEMLGLPSANAVALRRSRILARLAEGLQDLDPRKDTQ